MVTENASRLIVTECSIKEKVGIVEREFNLR
jgi:hypothetical protein